jgi:hypothetical protein
MERIKRENHGISEVILDADVAWYHHKGIYWFQPISKHAKSEFAKRAYVSAKTRWFQFGYDFHRAIMTIRDGNHFTFQQVDPPLGLPG